MATTRPDGVNHPADVHAQGERWGRGYRHQLAQAAVDVVEVQRGRSDLDPHFAGFGFGPVDVAHRQDNARPTMSRHL
jgi:hypothetical protein